MSLNPVWFTDFQVFQGSIRHNSSNHKWKVGVIIVIIYEKGGKTGNLTKGGVGWECPVSHIQYPGEVRPLLSEYIRWGRPTGTVET